jgi:hypothetical protein
MKKEYRSLVVDDQLIKVFFYDFMGDYPEEIQCLEHLKGVKIIPATPEDFLKDYVRRNGQCVEV